MNVLEIRKTIYVYNIIASVDKRLIVWCIFNLIAKNIKKRAKYNYFWERLNKIL